MAQRRSHLRHGYGGALRRIGLSGGRLAAVGLVVAALSAAGVGLVVQRRPSGFALVRSTETVDAASAATQADMVGTGVEDGVSDVPTAQPQSYRVHVDGAVVSPGVVELMGTDLRVADAVDACGGLTSEADTTGVNLAEPLMDGSKIHIPVFGEQASEPAGDVAVGQAQTVGTTGMGEGQVLVNINTASAAELQQLKGIGEVTAQAIVDDRTRNGPFASPEDLMRVSGIGEKKFEGVRGSICV